MDDPHLNYITKLKGKKHWKGEQNLKTNFEVLVTDLST
jgi:hypothetical protein